MGFHKFGDCFLPFFGQKGFNSLRELVLDFDLFEGS